MRVNGIVSMVLLAGLCLGLSGCLVIASDKKSMPTAGRELMDLKAAHQSGAMSDQEYEVARQRVLSDKHD
jgi:hypothetical protein